MDNKEKIILISLSIVVLILLFYVVIFPLFENKNQSNKEITNNFQTLTSNQNNIKFQITPLSASEFQIAMNTHSVNLDFDLTQISTLHDNLKNDYKPLEWEGSEPSGHHRSGILKFQSIDNRAKSIKLIIKDSTRREFEWNLR